jgi:hypothetical protein
VEEGGNWNWNRNPNLSQQILKNRNRRRFFIKVKNRPNLDLVRRRFGGLEGDEKWT